MKINLNQTALNSYIETVKNLKPNFTNALVQTIQDVIEVNGVEYSDEDIRTHSFLEFSAGYYPDDSSVIDADMVPSYSFALVHNETDVIDITLSLQPNEERTQVVVNDLEVSVK